MQCFALKKNLRWGYEYQFYIKSISVFYGTLEYIIHSHHARSFKKRYLLTYIYKEQFKTHSNLYIWSISIFVETRLLNRMEAKGNTWFFQMKNLSLIKLMSIFVSMLSFWTNILKIDEYVIDSAYGVLSRNWWKNLSAPQGYSSL